MRLLAALIALCMWPVAAFAQQPGQNTIWAGPSTGGAGFPSFRNLVVGDLPQLNAKSFYANPTGSAASAEQVTLDPSLNWSGPTLVCTTATNSQNGCGHPDASTIIINGAGQYSTGSAIPTLAGNNAFAGTNTFGGAFQVSSSDPWSDVMAFGATASAGSSNTDDHTAFQNAVNAAGNGLTWVPHGTYCIKASVSMTTALSRMSGAGKGSILEAGGPCSTDTTILSVNATEIQVDHLSLYGKGSNNDTGSFGSSNGTLVIGTSCVDCHFGYLDVFGGEYNIQNQSGEADFYFIKGGAAYGGAMVYVTGGGWYDRMKLDTQSPYSPAVLTSTISAWASSHNYSVGQYATLSNYLIQVTACVSSCTSAGSSPTLKNYGQSFTDNQVTWQTVWKSSGCGFQLDTGANENYLSQVDMSGSTAFFAGFCSTNNGAGAAPTNFKCSQCIAAGLDYGYLLSYGEFFRFFDSDGGVGLSSAAGGSGAIQQGTTYSGYMNVIGGSYSGPYGVVIQSLVAVVDGGWFNDTNVNVYVAGGFNYINVTDIVTSGFGTYAIQWTSAGAHCNINNNAVGGSAAISNPGSGCSVAGGNP